MTISKEQVTKALSTVMMPSGDGTIISNGIVSEPFITQGDKGAKVMFSLSVPADMVQRLEPLRLKAQRAVEQINGVASVMVAMTAERQASQNNAPPAAQGHAHQSAQKPGVVGVTNIIAVASGKGGVGKSTSAINLALGLKNQGLNVGLMDADIYGPSVPRLVGLSGKPETDGQILKPMEAFGLKVMSIGFLVEEDTPMIWRGPMVISALTQLLREVSWGTEENPLDVLVVDMPPGTGDAQLTMAQQVPLAGAVIISTPQDLSLIDARKGLNMFKKVNVPIMGIVENMSTFICPKCGERSDIFGHGGAQEEASRLGVPFLGGIPLHMDIRSNSDDGTPVVASNPDGEHAAIYNEIAQKLAASLADEKPSGPAIVFE